MKRLYYFEIYRKYTLQIKGIHAKQGIYPFVECFEIFKEGIQRRDRFPV